MADANPRNINRSERDRKAFWQKVLAGVLVAGGLSLTLAALLVPGLNFMLAVSVPVLVAGFGVTGSILDPRDRYIFNYNRNNTTTANQTEYNADLISKMKRALSRYGIRLSPPNSDRTEAPSNDPVLDEMVANADNPSIIIFTPERDQPERNADSIADEPTSMEQIRPRRAMSDSALQLSSY